MTLAESINRMIRTILESSTWTSAGGKNPVDNFIKEFRGDEFPDLEAEISGATDDEELVKKETEIDDAVQDISAFKTGNVGDIQRMTGSQFGNIKQIATNPFGFFLGIFSKRVIRAASVVGFAFILFEIVKFIIFELMKAGRPLDRAFKRIAANETFLFFTRQEQEKARRGFIDIRVTTTQGLRGGFGQVSGNLFVHGSPNYPQENRFSPVVEVLTSASKGFATDADGNPKGGHRTGAGPGK